MPDKTPDMSEIDPGGTTLNERQRVKGVEGTKLTLVNTSGRRNLRVNQTADRSPLNVRDLPSG